MESQVGLQNLQSGAQLWGERLPWVCWKVPANTDHGAYSGHKQAPLGWDTPVVSALRTTQTGGKLLIGD